MRNPTPFIKKMDEAGVMPIFFHPDEKTCLKLLEIAYNSGVKVIEMVNRGPEAMGNFPALRKLADNMPGLILGAGTIYHPEEAEKYLDMGAEFIVAPVMNPKLGEYCKKLELPWVPGCGSISEIWEAYELGAELVKLYPGNVLTPGFVPPVHAVLPKVEIIPTGGVEPTMESIKSWFDVGVLCVGMGSQLFRKDLVAAGKFDEIKERIETVIAIINKIKAER